MRIAHVIPSFWPSRAYGGAIESTYGLCRHLARQGCRVRVLTTDADGARRLDVTTDREVEAERLRIRYCARVMRQSVSPTCVRLLPGYLRWADVVHLTGVYSFPTIPTLLACRVLRKPLVWSPRGALQRWHGSRRRAGKAVWDTVCRGVRPTRMVLHVTSEEEGRESLLRLPAVSPVVIPNGVEIPDAVERPPADRTLRLLYLGRLEPKKGVENLLAACRLIDGAGLDWRLIVAGGGDPSYVGRLEGLVGELGLREKVKMIGPVGGDAKEELFASADIVLVPSYTENFGLVVAEALARRVPVIAATGTPWRRLTEVGCGLWVDNDPGSLATAIRQMSGMPIRRMGERGREWMQREFCWEVRTREMIDCYQRSLAVGSRALS
jgi:glycosyltransferase involved in cell wall biosynthesis